MLAAAMAAKNGEKWRGGAWRRISGGEEGEMNNGEMMGEKWRKSGQASASGVSRISLALNK